MDRSLPYIKGGVAKRLFIDLNERPVEDETVDPNDQPKVALLKKLMILSIQAEHCRFIPVVSNMINYNFSGKNISIFLVTVT